MDGNNTIADEMAEEASNIISFDCLLPLPLLGDVSKKIINTNRFNSKIFASRFLKIKTKAEITSGEIYWGLKSVFLRRNDSIQMDCIKGWRLFKFAFYHQWKLQLIYLLAFVILIAAVNVLYDISEIGFVALSFQNYAIGFIFLSAILFIPVLIFDFLITTVWFLIKRRMVFISFPVGEKDFLTLEVPEPSENLLWPQFQDRGFALDEK